MTLHLVRPGARPVVVDGDWIVQLGGLGDERGAHGHPPPIDVVACGSSGFGSWGPGSRIDHRALIAMIERADRVITW